MGWSPTVGPNQVTLPNVQSPSWTKERPRSRAEPLRLELELDLVPTSGSGTAGANCEGPDGEGRLDKGRPPGRLGAGPRATDGPGPNPAPTRIDPQSVVSQLIEAHQAALVGREAEGVHQLRVACRRLVVWHAMAGRRTLVDDLRWLRRAAGEVRDLDVLLARTLPGELVPWLEERRAQARQRLQTVLDSGRIRGLLEALRWLEPIRAERVALELVRQRRKVARRAAALERHEDDPHRERVQLHALRRSLRGLRYTLAWVDRRPKRLERLQAALGGLNDLEQLLAQLEVFPRPLEVVELVADVEARTAASQAACCAAWEEARDAVLLLTVEE